MAKSKKGHNFAILGPTEKNIHLLIFCTDAYLNTDPNLYVRYQNRSSSGSQGILLTRFLHCIMAES